LHGRRGVVAAPEEGLLVVPALTTPELSMLTLRGRTVTTLFAGVATGERDHVGLTTLLGAVRAAILRCLAEPQTMTEIGEHLLALYGADRLSGRHTNTLRGRLGDRGAPRSTTGS
jgi:hypothetical protein